MPSKSYSLSVSHELAKMLEEEQAILASEMGVATVSMQTVQRKLLLLGLQQRKEERKFKHPQP